MNQGLACTVATLRANDDALQEKGNILSLTLIKIQLDCRLSEVMM
jgi:hypothetical protein